MKIRSTFTLLISHLSSSQSEMTFESSYDIEKQNVIQFFVGAGVVSISLHYILQDSIYVQFCFLFYHLPFHHTNWDSSRLQVMQTLVQFKGSK